MEKSLGQKGENMGQKENEIIDIYAKRAYDDYRYFLQVAIHATFRELRKDKEGGSLYHSWQSNLAMVIMDNSDLDHNTCNKIACIFLDRLIKVVGDL